ncbi:MAG: helix-turn-helix domain-containing protein [Puniceicoccales bacterium]
MTIQPSLSKNRPLANLHDWSSLGVNLYFIYDLEIPAGQGNMKQKRSAEFSAWFVRRGWAHVICDGYEVQAGVGEWLLCFGENIEQTFSDDVHLLSMRLKQNWPDGRPLFSGSPLYLLEGEKVPRLEKLAIPLLQLVKKRTWKGNVEDPNDSFLWGRRIDCDTYFDYQIRLFQWLRELARVMRREGVETHVPNAMDSRLVRAIQTLDSTLPGDSFPEDEIVHATGLSLGRLNRLAANEWGCSLNAYWENRRVAHARKGIEFPAKRIKEIASELGFSQLSHFSAWFKRHFGDSPRAYRAKIFRKDS